MLIPVLPASRETREAPRDPATVWALAARTGDADAVERFVRALHPDVVRYITRLSCDRQLADDLTQDTFLRALALDTWDAVADRDAPRTTSAADLDLALNDMDAQAANILLSSGNAGEGRCGPRTRRLVVSTATPGARSATICVPSPSRPRGTGSTSGPWSPSPTASPSTRNS